MVAGPTPQRKSEATQRPDSATHCHLAWRSSPLPGTSRVGEGAAGAGGQQLGAEVVDAAGRQVGPGRRFWLGAGQLGRDVLVRAAYGGRISLLVGIAAYIPSCRQRMLPSVSVNHAALLEPIVAMWSTVLRSGMS